MGTKVREKEYLGVVNNIKKGYNSDLSSDCGNSFINHPEGFFYLNLYSYYSYYNNLKKRTKGSFFCLP
jgi:hypothetical protein